MGETRQQATINPREIHLWCVTLTVPEECSQKLFATLAAEEQKRALRYRSLQHRRDFAVGRGLLRAILGEYLGEKPEQISISYERHGKPELANRAVLFNLSHSGRLMVIAIALEPTLGVDIEQVRSLPERDAMVRQHFSHSEQENFFSVPELKRDEAFFRLWTRKEALLKASGSGWAERSEESKLSIFDWSPGNGYIGAVAIAGRDWRLIEIPASRLQSYTGLESA